MYEWDFGIVWEYRIVFIEGALITAQLTVFAWAIGVVLGLAIALARLSRFVWVRVPAAFFVEAFRSTPALVQLVWIYYALPIITGLQLSGFMTVVVGLGLHTSAYFGEIFRGGIVSIERGQVDAAKAVGMVGRQAMVRIILPQAVRRMLPPFMNETANLVKLTSLASVLAVYELLHASNNLITNTYRPLEVYTTAAVAFAVIIYPIVYAARRMERYWGVRS